MPLAAAATRLNDDDKKYTNKKETTYYSTLIHANQCSVVYFLFFLLVVHVLGHAFLLLQSYDNPDSTLMGGTQGNDLLRSRRHIFSRFVCCRVSG